MLARMRHGIDVSDHQGVVDWPLVAAGGYSFGIVKTSEGQTFQAKTLLDNGFGASTSCLDLTYYHYARLDTIDTSVLEDADLEAKNFLGALGKVPDPQVMTFQTGRTAAVWIDLEKTADNLDEEQGLDWLLEFFRVVEGSGFPCGIYGSERWLDAEVTPTKRSAQQLLNRLDGTQRAFWVARYGLNLGYPEPQYDPDEKIPPEWLTWDVWQYTSKGKVTGIEGNCVLDLCR